MKNSWHFYCVCPLWLWLDVPPSLRVLWLLRLLLVLMQVAFVARVACCRRGLLHPSGGSAAPATPPGPLLQQWRRRRGFHHRDDFESYSPEVEVSLPLRELRVPHNSLPVLSQPWVDAGRGQLDCGRSVREVGREQDLEHQNLHAVELDADLPVTPLRVAVSGHGQVFLQRDELPFHKRFSGRLSS